MRRRTLLARVGAVAAVGAVAGCLDDGTSPGAGGGDEDGDGDGSANETDGADDGENETDGGEGVDDGDGNESDGENETDDEGADGTGDDGDEDESNGDESGDGETHASGSFDGGRYSLRTTETACGDDDEATVEVEGETVAVTGQIRAPDPCHDAVLSRTNAGGDELEVYVGVESTGGVCQQCLGTVAYEATFEFDDGVPATVSVWHESRDTTREVASASTD